MTTPQQPDYEAISDKSHELFWTVNQQMSLLDSATDPRWNELYDLMQLAHVINTTAGRYRDRQRESAEVIPVPDEWTDEPGRVRGSLGPYSADTCLDSVTGCTGGHRAGEHA